MSDSEFSYLRTLASYERRFPVVREDFDLQSIFSVGDVVVAMDDETVCVWNIRGNLVFVYEMRPLYWADREVWRLADSVRLPDPVTFESARDAANDWIKAANEKAAREADESST